MSDQDTMNELVASLADDMRDIVTEIEGGMQTTQNHYGRYLHILLMPKEVTIRKVTALALLAAGANAEGVAAAARNAW